MKWGFQDTGHQLMKDTIPKRQDTNKGVSQLPPCLCPETFQISAEREGNQEKAQQTPWVAETKLRAQGNKAARVHRAVYQTGERCKAREPQRSEGSPPWVFNICLWGKTWGKGKNHPKELEGLVPSDHAEPRTVLVPAKKSEKKIHQALGRVLSSEE